MANPQTLRKASGEPLHLEPEWLEPKWLRMCLRVCARKAAQGVSKEFRDGRKLAQLHCIPPSSLPPSTALTLQTHMTFASKLGPARVRPNSLSKPLAEHPPNLGGQLWPNTLWPISVADPQVWPKSANTWRNWGRDRLILAASVPILAELGQNIRLSSRRHLVEKHRGVHSADIGSKFDRARTQFVQIGPSLARFGPAWCGCTQVEVPFTQEMATTLKTISHVSAIDGENGKAHVDTRGGTSHGALLMASATGARPAKVLFLAASNSSRRGRGRPRRGRPRLRGRGAAASDGCLARRVPSVGCQRLGPNCRRRARAARYGQRWIGARHRPLDQRKGAETSALTTIARERKRVRRIRAPTTQEARAPTTRPNATTGEARRCL